MRSGGASVSHPRNTAPSSGGSDVSFRKNTAQLGHTSDSNAIVEYFSLPGLRPRSGGASVSRPRNTAPAPHPATRVVSPDRGEIDILLPNNQRQYCTSHALKDVLPLRICANHCVPTADLTAVRYLSMHPDQCFRQRKFI